MLLIVGLNLENGILSAVDVADKRFGHSQSVVSAMNDIVSDYLIRAEWH